jgi:hypothetical protein
MGVNAMELELPLGEWHSGDLARLRQEHLRRMVGDDQAAMARLVAAFRNLGSIYSASEAELARVVGPILAARMRWFLEAPLTTSRHPAQGGGLRQAA